MAKGKLKKITAISILSAIPLWPAITFTHATLTKIETHDVKIKTIDEKITKIENKIDRVHWYLIERNNVQVPKELEK